MIDESQHGARVDAWMDRTLEGNGPASCASSAAVWSTRSTMAVSVTTNETADVARIRTGVRNLDALFLDGPPKRSGVIIEGPPGSGKTILTQQICFHTASPEGPVLYLNTLGQGSTLFFTLPVAAPAASRPATPQPVRPDEKVR